MSDTATTPENPIETILRIGSGLWLSRALWAAARLRVADGLGETPRSAEEIAAECGARPDMLRRLMNALAGAGIFAADGDGRFSHSDLSRLLRSDHPLSQRAFVESVFGHEHYAAWGEIEQSLRSGTTAFDHRYGMPVFAYFSQLPEVAALFSEAMTSTTRLMEAVLLASYEPPPFGLAVDVGGSRGTLLAGLLDRHRDARGILFDLPDLVAQVRPQLGERIEAIGGDFFESVPEADLYLLKFILHDWTDAQCEAILANVRAAIRPGGHVLIIENVLPETVSPHPGYLMDLNMMAMTGGRERTAAEFRALLERSGFAPGKVTLTPSLLSVVEATPA